MLTRKNHVISIHSAGMTAININESMTAKSHSTSKVSNEQTLCQRNLDRAALPAEYKLKKLPKPMVPAKCN